MYDQESFVDPQVGLPLSGNSLPGYPTG